jgi:ABC-type cobalamin/Fe3+-siderophores transport system ATPase subunit
MPVNSETTAAGSSPAPNGVVMDCQLQKVFYGDFLAVRDSTLPLEKNKITGFIGPSGCGKSTVLRSLNRMNDLIPVFRFEGKVTYHGQDIYDKQGRSGDGAALHRHGVSAAQPVRDEHLRQRGVRPAPERFQGQHGRAGGEGAQRCGHVERGQGQAEKQRPVAVRRPAAAACASPAPSPPNRMCC